MSTFRPMLVQTRADESAVVRKKKKKVKELQEQNPGLGFIDAQKIVDEKEKADDKARQKKSEKVRKTAAKEVRKNLGLTGKSKTKSETKSEVKTKPKVKTKVEVETKSKPKPKPKPKSKLKFKRTASGFKPVREKTSTEKKPSFIKKSKSSTTSKDKEISKVKDDPKDIFGTPKSKRDAVKAKALQEIMERRRKKKEKDNKEKPKKKKFMVGRR